MSILKKHGKNIEIGLLCLFVFAVFYYISKSVPLAGDDWNYANMGRNLNPFVSAFQFYFTWSGRYFSELYGIMITPHKEIWNVLNASLFTLLFFGINKLVNNNKNKYLIPLIIVAIMFSVNQELRIQTYTWLMGTTYVIPLVIFVYYLIIIKKYYVIKKEKLTNMWMIVTCVMNIYICLCMENMSSTILLANILILIYLYLKKSPYKKQMYILLFASIIGVCLIKFSPGATYRMRVDNQAWNELSLIEKLVINWPNFLHLTFIDNNYLVLLFSIIMGISAINMRLNKKYLKYVFILFHIIVLIMSLSPFLYEITGKSILYNLYTIDSSKTAMIICSTVYVLYILICIIQLIYINKTCPKDESLFYLLLAGSANIIMMISPIFESRSSLYTVYLLLILICYVLSYIEVNKYITFCGIILCVYLIAIKSYEFKTKYSEIARINYERMNVIDYYKDRPEEIDVWIPRMPKGWIHSADIEDDDEYHMNSFKEYYGLKPYVTIRFYYQGE